MAGCSKGAWITSDGTNVYIDGDVAVLTEFDGTSGKYQTDTSEYKVFYSKCVPEIRDCPSNRQGVHEADLSTYKKSNYFIAYMGSMEVMHIPYGDEVSIEASIESSDGQAFPADNMREDVYKTISGLKFGPITETVFNNAVKVSCPTGVIVRATDITIPGVLSVGLGQKECTQQVQIGEITCMKYESTNYDFYQYGSNLIKAVKGTDISQYITLLGADD